MLDAPGMPPYPPTRNTWNFPPPEVPGRWKWIAVAAGVVGLAVTTALVAVLVVVGGKDFPGVIEDTDLLDTIAAECELMTSTVESMPIAGSRQRQAATVADQDRAVELMVASIRDAEADAISTDRPTGQWLSDWERLVRARDDYALALLREPDADLEIPLDPDGVEITERMDEVWLGDSVCPVPDILTSPYTDALSDA